MHASSNDTTSSMKTIHNFRDAGLVCNKRARTLKDARRTATTVAKPTESK